MDSDGRGQTVAVQPEAVIAGTLSQACVSWPSLITTRSTCRSYPPESTTQAGVAPI